MKINDLTSDGNHSVTVAGRDGAGRLGKESEELTFYFRGKLYHYVNRLTGHDCFVLTYTVLTQQPLLPSWKIVLGLCVAILSLLAITIGIFNVVLRGKLCLLKQQNLYTHSFSAYYAH